MGSTSTILFLHIFLRIGIYQSLHDPSLIIFHSSVFFKELPSFYAFSHIEGRTRKIVAISRHGRMGLKGSYSCNNDNAYVSPTDIFKHSASSQLYCSKLFVVSLFEVSFSSNRKWEVRNQKIMKCIIHNCIVPYINVIE